MPAEAEVWYFVRAPDRDEVDRISAWVTDIAEAAATMTQTDVERRYITGCYDFLPNETVTDVIWENMQEAGSIEYDDDDREFAAELRETVADDRLAGRFDDAPDEVEAAVGDAPLYGEPVEAYDEGEVGGGSTDVGDVSWIAPTGQFRAATWPIGAPGHGWQVVAANGDFASKGAVFAAKVLGGTVADLLADEETVERANEEFAEATADGGYDCPLPEDVEPPFDVTADD